MAARSGIALSVVGVCAAIALVRTRPPSPRGADAPASEFSTARAMETLRRVLGDGAPHPVGSEEHERVRERIVAELRGLGLEPVVEEGIGVSGSRRVLPRRGVQHLRFAGPTALAWVRNVVARIPGTEATKAILLSAHYDSVPAGAGAGDDGSGVATLLEVARALKAGPPPRRPVILLLDDAEECRMLGAEAYVSAHEVEDDTEVVVNCDARGMDGPAYLFETSDGNADLVRLYARSVERPCATSAAYEVYKRMPNDTDLTVFKRVGLAGLNFAFIGGGRRYHTPRDDLAHLSAASLQHEGDQVLGLARALANEEFRARSDGDLVYSDVLGWAVLRWPASVSLPFSIAILLATLALAIPNLRRSAPSVGRGFLFALASVGSAAIVAPAIVHGIEILRREPEPWGGHPLPFVIAIASAGALAVLLISRRASFEEAWNGFWIALAAAGVACAARVPGASYLFLAPCVVAVAARLSRIEFLAMAAPACALAILWVPLAVGVEQAVELRVPVALGVPVGILVASACPSRSSVACRVLAIVLLGSIGWAIAAPSSTAEDPAHVTLAHVEGPDTDARIVAVTGDLPLPKELAAAAPFSASRQRVFREVSWLPDGYTTPVPSAPADAARIEVLETRPEPRARVVDVRCSSPRGAPCLVAHLRDLLHPPGGPLTVRVRMAGKTVETPSLAFLSFVRPDGMLISDADLLLFGAPREGAVLTLRVPLDGSGEILLLDSAGGLPPGDARFAEARPERCVPSSQGDQWVVARRADL